jgi:2,4-didehydro-3-deoxy-L-rhamnonate hydrolase
MRIANVTGRAHLVAPLGAALYGVEIAKISNGLFGPSVFDLLEDWPRFQEWVRLNDPAVTTEDALVDPLELDAPVPFPRQIFAIGMNYADHADEVSIARPETPSVFTKFATSITGPHAEVVLSSAEVDWEVEAVAVIGRRGRHIEPAAAYSHIAGLMVGQDLSDRAEQFRNASPQFSMAKSYPGYAPTGPWITTVDELPNPNDLTLECHRQDGVLQQGTTRKLLFDVPTLIAYLSSITELLPGDLVFTGTPDGVGYGRDPREYLRPGDRLISSASGLGSIEQTFISNHSGAIE